jgi:hypothetical protein
MLFKVAISSTLNRINRIGNMLGAHNAKGAALATRVALFLTMAVALFMRLVHPSLMADSDFHNQCNFLDLPKALVIYVQ